MLHLIVHWSFIISGILILLTIGYFILTILFATIVGFIIAFYNHRKLNKKEQNNEN
jgi:5-bromo-4-chloroindolyl phosphate hydrolysis protein